MNAEKEFDIPVVLFIFKRNKIADIIERISEVKPQKLYLIGDYGRNDEENKLVKECRELAESKITWPCEVIKNYATENRGVYGNIALGAKWIFDREKYAIFLEDDNLPEITFFQFCKEMLLKYENDTRILWICGTNYLGKYNNKNGDSYMFTKHLLPCGWASWSQKFNSMYDEKLSLCDSYANIERVSKEYYNKKLFNQYRTYFLQEYDKIKNGLRPASWDYQMDFCIKANNVYGICPCVNQIKNIGVDDLSIHVGNSFSNIMTKRFCSMDSYPLSFPLKHPKLVLSDLTFERKIYKILLYPFKLRLRIRISTLVKKIFRISNDVSLKKSFFKKGGEK